MCPIYVSVGEPHPVIAAPRGWLVWKMCRRRSGSSGLCDQHALDLRQGRLAPVGKWEPLPEIWLA